MTPNELKTLIESDAQALALAEAGAADRCAERCRVIAPKVLGSKLMSYRSIASVSTLETLARLISSVDLFCDSGHPLSPVVREMRNYLRGDGVDLGHASTQQMLSLFAADTNLPLTNEDFLSLKESASDSQHITGADITTAMMEN